jgi:hypothetical protein
MDKIETALCDLAKYIVRPSSQTGTSRLEAQQKLPPTARQTFVRWIAVQFISFQSFASETFQGFMTALFPRLKRPGETTLMKGLIEYGRLLEHQLAFEESNSPFALFFTSRCLKVES